MKVGFKVANLIGSTIDYYISCDGEKLPFEDGYFDVVFGSAVIHHFVNVEIGLKEIYRVLKDGGLYIGINETANNAIIGAYSKSRFGIAGERQKRRKITEKVYSYKEWITLFQRANFRLISINLDRKLEYKLQTYWFIPLYYKIISFVPDFFVKHFLASSISIYAKK